MSEKKATRVAYGEALVELAKKNDKVVVLDADLAQATQTAIFQKAFPERHFDLGIAEANMVDVANGMSCMGLIPFGSPFAGITPSQPNVIPKRGFILRIARISANARHRASRSRVQLGIDELHDGRKLVAQFAHRPLDKALVARLIRRVERLIVVKPNIVQEVERLL